MTFGEAHEALITMIRNSVPQRRLKNSIVNEMNTLKTSALGTYKIYTLFSLDPHS